MATSFNSPLIVGTYSIWNLYLNVTSIMPQKVIPSYLYPIMIVKFSLWNLSARIFCVFVNCVNWQTKKQSYCFM